MLRRKDKIVKYIELRCSVFDFLSFYAGTNTDKQFEEVVNEIKDTRGHEEFHNGKGLVLSFNEGWVRVIKVP